MNKTPPETLTPPVRFWNPSSFNEPITCWAADAPRSVYVADLFDSNLSFDDLERIYGIMAMAHQHQFWLSTCRPGRMYDFFEWLRGRSMASIILSANQLLPVRHRSSPADDTAQAFPPRNIALGVNVVDQATADELIPLLLMSPAAVRFALCTLDDDTIDLTAFLSPGGVLGDSEHAESSLDAVIFNTSSHLAESISVTAHLEAQCSGAGVGCFWREVKFPASQSAFTPDEVAPSEMPDAITDIEALMREDADLMAQLVEDADDNPISCGNCGGTRFDVYSPVMLSIFDLEGTTGDNWRLSYGVKAIAPMRDASARARCKRCFREHSAIDLGIDIIELAQ